jgi:polysaccharide pyruvyl transferase WcaK-like protein
LSEQSTTGARTAFDRIFLSGYFGFGNLGDEAILEALTLELRARHPSSTILATFGPDRSTAGRLDVVPVDFFDLDATAHAIATSDVVLFGLGGVFQDYWGATSAAMFKPATNGVEAWARPALIARMEGVPAVLFCAGVGPLRSLPGRTMFRMACGAAARLIVRDETSASELVDILPDATPTIAADPAHRLVASEEDRRNVSATLQDAGITDPPVTVAVRAWDLGLSRETLVGKLAQGLRPIAADHPLVFAPFHCGAGTDDRDVAEAILEEIGSGQGPILEMRTAGQAIALFERSRLVVAARNHGVVFAGCAGTPVVALRYDPKVTSCAAALGLGHLALDLDELDRLAEAISQALTTGRVVAEGMAARRSGLDARICRAFDDLDRVLARDGDSVLMPAGRPQPAPDREPYQRLLQARRTSRLNALEASLVRLRHELRAMGDTLRHG